MVPEHGTPNKINVKMGTWNKIVSIRVCGVVQLGSPFQNAYFHIFIPLSLQGGIYSSSHRFVLITTL